MTALRATPLPWRAGLSYGLLGLPLAFAALPLYVVLPNYYARTLGLPLASVGLLLMLVRLLDAVTEPLLGRLSDRLYAHSVRAVLWLAGVSALVQMLAENRCPPLSEFYELVLQAQAAGVLLKDEEEPRPPLARRWWLRLRCGWVPPRQHTPVSKWRSH